MATPEQLSTFLSQFYVSWGASDKSQQAYTAAITYAENVTGIRVTNKSGPDAIAYNEIPSYVSLTSGGGGSVSTGSVIGEAQQSQQPSANTTAPPNTPVVQPAARVTPAVAEGTETPVVSGTQTQSVPPAPLNTGGPPVTPAPSTQQVAGATTGSFAKDDAARSNSSEAKDVLRQRIDTLYGQSNLINNQRNILDEYENTSYQLSWYLLPPGGYSALSSTPNKALSNYYLLAQSGGAAEAASQPSALDAGLGVYATAGTVPNSGRSPFFDVDFYLDNLEIVTRFPLAGTRASHTNVELSFTVNEPYGLSLVPRLQNAVEDVYKQAGIWTSQGARYSSALYVMVIKFWGTRYDGKIERVVTRRADGTVIGPVEKYIPFVIRELKFAQSNRTIEYKIIGNPPLTFIGFGQERGIALERYNLTGKTVKDVLGSVSTATGTAASDGRPSSAAPTTPPTN